MPTSIEQSERFLTCNRANLQLIRLTVH